MMMKKKFKKHFFFQNKECPQQAYAHSAKLCNDFSLYIFFICFPLTQNWFCLPFLLSRTDEKDAVLLMCWGQFVLSQYVNYLNNIS